MNRRKLPVRAAFHEGWKQTIKHPRAFVTLGLINLLLAIAEQSTLAPWGSAPMRPALGLTMQLLHLCLGLIYIRFALTLCDGRGLAPLVGRGVLRGFLTFATTALTYGVIVVFGLVLLVYPGVIWGLDFAFAPMLAVDRDLDPVAALKESARLTAGVRSSLFGFIVLCILLNALGASLMGFGLILTVPITMVAQAYLLRQLQSRLRGVAPPPAPAPFSAPSHA